MANYHSDTTMRRSSLPRHPLAVLRQILNIGQHELAEICGCSPRTIGAIELRALELSGSLAQRIQRETGADLEWLLSGDPNWEPKFSESLLYASSSDEIPSMLSRGIPYTREAFDKLRAKLQAETHKRQIEGMPPHPERTLAVSRIPAILKSAEEKGCGDLAHYRLRQFVSEFEKEFGLDAAENASFMAQLKTMIEAEYAYRTRQEVRRGLNPRLVDAYRKAEAEVDTELKKELLDARERGDNGACNALVKKIHGDKSLDLLLLHTFMGVARVDKVE